MNRHYHALELDKILELLAGQTNGPDAAQAARELRPVPVLAEVKRLQQETAAAFTLMARFGSPSFGQLKNMSSALRRAEAGSSLSMRELLDVAETLRGIRSLTEWRSHCEGVSCILDDRFSVLAPNKYLEDKITTSIVSEEQMADNASPALSDIRRKIRAASQRVREQMDHMIHSPAYQKFLQDPIVTIRDGRFVVPVKAEHRGDVPGLVHDTSASGATLFVEPMGAVNANNEIKMLTGQEEAEIERILAALSAETGQFAGAILEDYAIVVELNLIFAKARLGYQMKGGMPDITDDGHIYLKQARHPLIDPQKVVPVDVELGGAFDTLVITGPNTGGKTVTLKTIGLLTLMAMCGLMPPVSDGSSLSVFTDVLADIGDEQSIEQSLSTFSAHMTNLIRILGEAGHGSLVLMDELGAGTDPVEGAALAIAILERLREQGARIAATTHYAELKEYAIHTSGVENGSCEFDVATLRPTYRLLVGVPGRSNAFAISTRLGMDDGVVERARELVSAENRRMEDVVSRLEEQRQWLEQELADAQAARLSAQNAGQKAQQRMQELQKQRERELEKARADARQIVERARRQAEQLMDELDALRKQAKSAPAAATAKSELRSRLREMEEAADPVDHRKPEAYRLPRPLKAGDEVRIVDIDKAGMVTAPADASGYVEVQAGIIRTRVKVDNLRLLSGVAAKGKTTVGGKRTRTLPSTIDRAVTAEIDLRGQMTDEGILELDRFIDDAVMQNTDRITVIHGKGTGALRQAVHQFLRSHPSVKSYRLGVYGEGENGVTIVELK